MANLSARLSWSNVEQKNELHERDQAVALFLSHCDMEYELATINRFIIDRAVILTQNNKLRGYDAVQLATALTANAALTAAGLSSLTFVAADDDLVAAARAEGLTAENPNAQL
jgi:predicted nucleic acid-binding protein